MKTLRIVFVITLSSFALVFSAPSDYVLRRAPTLAYAEKRYGYAPNDYFVLISVEHQTLFLVKDGVAVKRYPVSTAKNGEGNEKGSEKTPLGFHRIAMKCGANAPVGTVFRGYAPTKQIATIITQKKKAEGDLMLTRLLTLEGLDGLRNKGGAIDSGARHIIIHGTQEEGLIGTKASHGCIRMRNKDIIELFALVPQRALVYIGY